MPSISSATHNGWGFEAKTAVICIIKKPLKSAAAKLLCISPDWNGFISDEGCTCVESLILADYANERRSKHLVQVARKSL